MASIFVNPLQLKLDRPVREHLRNVYGCLAATTATATAGAHLHQYLPGGVTYLAPIGSLVTLITLLLNPDNGKNIRFRLGLLLAFAMASGLTLGPLVQYAMLMSPSIVKMALGTTAAVFVSFTLSALYSRRGYWLFLGGMLGSLLSTMLMMSLMNVFIGSMVISKIKLYMGLFAMCAFVLYDTEAIIAKRRAGNKDFVTHSLDLFIDMLQIFKHLLFILMEKHDNERERKRRRD